MRVHGNFFVLELKIAQKGFGVKYPEAFNIAQGATNIRMLTAPPTVVRSSQKTAPVCA